MKSIFCKILKYSLVFSFLYFSLNIDAQNVSKLASIFPKSYGAWIYSDSIRVFNPESLYDYIDGGADSYLSYNFQGLLVATYNNAEKYITAEIYEHQSPLLAFGIYAQERPEKGNYLKIGAQGYQEEGILNFLCDRYYVKISSHDESAETTQIMKKIAEDLASRLDSEATLPGFLSYFPIENKVPNTETLINTNFLGYDFFSPTFVANYKIDDKKFRIFIIPVVSAEKASQILTKYAQATNSQFEGKEGLYDISDRHNGNVLLEWKGKYIWGGINFSSVEDGKRYLQMVQDRIGHL